MSEITAIAAELRAGNPDIQGLCLALSDWTAELRINLEEIQDAKRRRPEGQRREGGGVCATQDLTE